MCALKSLELFGEHKAAEGLIKLRHQTSRASSLWTAVWGLSQRLIEITVLYLFQNAHLSYYPVSINIYFESAVEHTSACVWAFWALIPLRFVVEQSLWHRWFLALTAGLEKKVLFISPNYECPSLIYCDLLRSQWRKRNPSSTQFASSNGENLEQDRWSLWYKCLFL